MTDPGTALATRARALAMAQGSNMQIAGALFAEGCTWPEAESLVTDMSEELQRYRWVGQMLGKERLFRLMTGEDLGKVRREHMEALDTFGRAFLGLTEREEVAKLLEQSAAKMAKDASKKGLRVA